MLFYLTLSNLGIFAGAALGARNTCGDSLILIFTAALLATIFFLEYVAVDYTRVVQMMEEQ